MRMTAVLALLCLFAGLVPSGLSASSEAPQDPEYTNRLIHESSPYLRLHAHNPVDWFPWGEEAIARARKENKPIFLSVGYSTCYWCHVMERETFANPEIAELMNRWFINIKVDREERPELDEIYMTATQLMTGRGGWPNSVFLTPKLEPFFAGTYFPPEDRGQRPGFPRLLEGIHQAWQTQRPEIDAQAGRFAAAIRETLSGGEAKAAAGAPEAAVADRTAAALTGRYDSEWGGFGNSQKFPSPSNLFFLWDRAAAGNDEAGKMVVATLHKMGEGAIYDQIDGGFHRYTLDRKWRVPHFEKMLYDNAHLAELLAVVGAETSDPELVRLARGTFDFILSEMRLGNGAFKSAIDAETDAVEGAFYIWTRDEVKTALGADSYELLAPIFGFDREPNFEHGRYTVFLTSPLSEHAKRLEISRQELIEKIAPQLVRLSTVRKKRKFPLVDDKVLTDWNGMAVAALARAGDLLGEPRYVAAAEKAARFLIGLTDSAGTQLHVWRNGEARVPAFLDDYAFLVRGLLALHDATENPEWLVNARRLTSEMENRLSAPGGGYYSSAASEDLLVRAKSASDGAIPSGNGIVILNLIRLSEITGDDSYRGRAAASMASFGEYLSRAPGALVTVAQGVSSYRAGEASATASRMGPEGLPGPSERLAWVVVDPSAKWVGEAEEGWRAFELALALSDGWHVNANPASLDFLIPTTIAGSEGRVRDLEYPAGELLELAFAEEELAVYSGQQVIRGRAGEELSELTLSYQVCDDRRCLQPVTREITIE